MKATRVMMLMLGTYLLFTTYVWADGRLDELRAEFAGRVEKILADTKNAKTDTGIAELKTKLAKAYYWRGVIEALDRKYAQARVFYEKALELDPAHIYARANLNEVKCRLKDPECRKSGGYKK